MALMLGMSVECYSPMRRKDHLHQLGKIEPSYPNDIPACQRVIMTRDRFPAAVRNWNSSEPRTA